MAEVNRPECCSKSFSLPSFLVWFFWRKFNKIWLHSAHRMNFLILCLLWPNFRCSVQKLITCACLCAAQEFLQVSDKNFSKKYYIFLTIVCLTINMPAYSNELFEWGPEEGDEKWPDRTPRLPTNHFVSFPTSASLASPGNFLSALPAYYYRLYMGTTSSSLAAKLGKYLVLVNKRSCSLFP